MEGIEKNGYNLNISLKIAEARDKHNGYFRELELPPV